MYVVLFFPENVANLPVILRDSVEINEHEPEVSECFTSWNWNSSTDSCKSGILSHVRNQETGADFGLFTQLWFCLCSTGQWWIHFHRWKRHPFCRHTCNKPKNAADQRTETNSSHSFRSQWKMVAGELKAPINQSIQSINQSLNRSIPYYLRVMIPSPNQKKAKIQSGMLIYF